ncbi:MAG: type II CRISPR-associated endonuclease Cas1 [Lachnospiraceae bacterium]|nr:type II CRISPR-associated endonuclease Cas1 [Lachnospiraceae bacterium]
MGWRTILITQNCKLSYQNEYMLIRNENLQMVHLSEISLIIVDTGQVSITSYLISELAKNKIKLIFVDELHNPVCETVPYYGSFNTSKKILSQIEWDKEVKEKVWQKIIQYKIFNQYKMSEMFEISSSDKLLEYVKDVQIGDSTNREGHASKVYFNLLFGKKFIRHESDNTNIALDYGYSILLSTFNKEIVSKGYITQLGINHKNEFNYFNFACDLMEPYRVLVDEVVYRNVDRALDRDYKIELIDVLNRKVSIDGKSQYVNNAIPIYIKSVLDSLENKDKIEIFNYEL